MIVKALHHLSGDGSTLRPTENYDSARVKRGESLILKHANAARLLDGNSPVYVTVTASDETYPAMGGNEYNVQSMYLFVPSH